MLERHQRKEDTQIFTYRKETVQLNVCEVADEVDSPVCKVQKCTTSIESAEDEF